MAKSTRPRSLGKYFDIGPAIIPVDLEAGAKTGFRVNMGNAETCAFVIYAGLGTAGDDLQFTVQEANAVSGGTAQNLAVITRYYTKDSLTLVGSEAWAEITQAVSASVTDAGGAGTSAEHSQMVVVEVGAEQLSDGFNSVLLNIPDLGSAGAKIGCAFYVLTGLKVGRAPANLPIFLQ